MKAKDYENINYTTVAVKMLLLGGDYQEYIDALGEDSSQAVRENLKKIAAVTNGSSEVENFAKETVYFMKMSQDLISALQDAQKCLPLSQATIVQATIDKYIGEEDEQNC